MSYAHDRAGIQAAPSELGLLLRVSHDFLTTSPEAVIGRLAMVDTQGALDAEQRRAWNDEIEILRTRADRHPA